MKLKFKIFIGFFLFIACISTGYAQKKNGITQWLTQGDSTILFALQPAKLLFTRNPSPHPIIEVDDSKTYQTVDGFGFALTQGSAMPIIRMSPAKRASLLRELFDTVGTHIGVSYIRLSIGASDLNEKIFSYDDLPEGQTDTQLVKFDPGPDRNDVIPVMKEIIAINPLIKILGSPWSPPPWMKTNNDTRGGRLKPEYYSVYAKYFVKYIQAMKAEGINIDAVTVQNEPLHPGNNPSLLMTAPEEAAFIKYHLGPAFKASHISTKILIYDHNADRPDYPISILDDPEAKKYIDGSAFHLYNGKIEALTDVHDMHPDRNIYFTEQMVVQFGRNENPTDPKINIAWPVTSLIIGATRNWSRNVLEWNLAANSQFTPYTDRGGCDMCQGAVSVDGDQVTRNLAYYSLAHASKFVRPGSIRIASGETDRVANVAFKTPDGKIVLVASNTTPETQTFIIRYKGKSAITSLTAGSVATYWWK
ncbi:MAG: glucosylceramidase [Chitinophagaceae bacterium]|nr:glucosylceramidase [Chitinophagaceae bacterium]